MSTALKLQAFLAVMKKIVCSYVSNSRELIRHRPLLPTSRSKQARDQHRMLAMSCHAGLS